MKKGTLILIIVIAAALFGLMMWNAYIQKMKSRQIQEEFRKINDSLERSYKSLLRAMDSTIIKKKDSL